MKLILIIITIVTPYIILAQDNMESEHDVNVSFSVPKTNIIDIASVNGNDITFSPIDIDAVANGMNFSLANNDLWLNYTVVKSTAFSHKRINVSVTAVNFPNGMTLLMKIDPDEGLGKGEMGTTKVGFSNLIPDAGPLEIISDIGSCFTGNGPNKGHNLHFKLNYDNTYYDELSTNFNTIITLTYTITD